MNGLCCNTFKTLYAGSCGVNLKSSKHLVALKYGHALNVVAGGSFCAFARFIHESPVAKHTGKRKGNGIGELARQGLCCLLLYVRMTILQEALLALGWHSMWRSSAVTHSSFPAVRMCSSTKSVQASGSAVLKLLSQLMQNPSHN